MSPGPRIPALLLLLAVVPAAARDVVPPDPAERALALEGHRRLLPVLADPPAPRAGQGDVDVLEYRLGLWLDLAGERIEGSNLIRFVAASGVGQADQLVLDLYDNLQVTGIEQGGVPLDAASWTHAANSLTVQLSSPAIEGGPAVDVRVRYQGQPVELSFGTLTFMTHGDPPAPLIFTLSEPFLGRGWWPCKDVPDDKAIVTVAVEAPSQLAVVSNGLVESIVAGRAGHSVTTWASRYPISTYLVSVSASDYVTWTDTYTSQDASRTMPVTHWAFPEHETAARRDFSRTPDMIDAFARIWGEYPFIEEKYGHAVVSLWGAMEHQTATSYGAQLIRGDNRYDYVVAHELGHQWWGDLVGPETFESIWLNEGFASYAEATWAEAEGGLGAYLAYMASMDLLATRGREFPGTVHQPDDYFNSTVYDKGAWVLHMLRWVIGGPAGAPDRESIDAVLRAHAQEHVHAVARTDQFEATVERVTGLELTWFFDQWVHRRGRPLYEVGWAAAPQAGGGFVTHLRVRQTQPQPFVMPVLVRMRFPSGAVREELVTADLALHDWSWATAEAPTAVEWDPDGWVLKAVTPVDIDRDRDGWPDWLDDCPDVPDPAQADSDGDGLADACDPGVDFDGDGTPNGSDCAPADAGAWTVPGPTLLRVRRELDGSATFAFEPADPAGQRAVVHDLAHGVLGDLLAQRTTAGATCRQGDVAGSTFADADPVSPGGDWYLAWPYNGCGERQPGGSWSSPCR